MRSHAKDGHLTIYFTDFCAHGLFTKMKYISE